ncbi:hypothetical protein CG717_07540 [Streptomyces sp. CB02613]|nr:hypothetical protein CG717_07540 [Streptomyces sp. CB02613]
MVAGSGTAAEAELFMQLGAGLAEGPAAYGSSGPTVRMRSRQGGPSVVSRRRLLPVQTSVLLTGPAPAVARIRRRRA